MCRVNALISTQLLQTSNRSEVEFVLKLLHASVSEELGTQNT